MRLDPQTRAAAWDELVKLIIKGCTHQEAAQMLGFSPATIASWCGNPAFKLKLARTRKLIFEKTEDIVVETAKKVEADMERLEEMIERGSRRALERLIEKLESENEHISLKAAIDLADRNPVTSKTRKVQADHRHLVLNAEQLAVLARAAREVDEDHQVGSATRVEPVRLIDSPTLGDELGE
jgi:predicted transcriptional regulator